MSEPTTPPPHSEEAETAVLGAMMLPGANAAPGVLAVIRSPQYFYADRHREIYAAMIDLQSEGRAIDLLTVTQKLRDRKTLDAAGSAVYVSTLANSVPTAANAVEYAGIVTEYYRRRELLNAARKLEADSRDPGKAPADTMNAARQIIAAIDQTGGLTRKSGEEKADAIREQFTRDHERGDGTLLGYKLDGFPKLRDAIEGLQPGFYIIAGRSHRGKTSLILNLFRDALESNPELRGCYFSFDDSYQIIVNRWRGMIMKQRTNAARYRMIDGNTIARRDEAERRIIDLIGFGRLTIYDLSEMTTVDEVEAAIDEQARRGPVVVAIDGLLNLTGSVEGDGIRAQSIELATRIKRIVDRLRVPVLVTVESRKRARDSTTTGSTPRQTDRITVDDIMETGKWHYHASVIWLVYSGLTDDEWKKEIGDFANRDKCHVPLTVDCDKNKLTGISERNPMTFFPFTGIIREGEGAAQ